MANKLLSELAKGTWSSLTAYTIGDIVDYLGSSYVCISNSTNNTPPNNTYWALLSNKGDTGSTGAKGDTGSTGSTGAKGDTGNTGAKGDTGSTGAKGDTGSKGDTGNTGSTGAKGDTGSKGDTGNTGTTGAKGDTGNTGSTGAKGDTGTKGDTGIAGAGVNWRGAWDSGTTYAEDDGVSYNQSSYISKAGSNLNNLPTNATYWDPWVAKGDTGSTGAKGDTGNTGSTGAKGDTGNTGATGDTGNTGAKGDTGNAGAKGDTGNSGAKGDTGNTGTTGTKGDTGSVLNQWNVDPTPDSDTSYSGISANLTANENQAFGDVCFMNSSGKMQLADADAIATASAIGMCLGTVLANGTVAYLLLGIARNDAWNWNPGSFVYLSTTGTTGNTITQTAPSGTDDVIQILGIALTADNIFFNPEITQIEHV